MTDDDNLHGITIVVPVPNDSQDESDNHIQASSSEEDEKLTSSMIYLYI